MTALAILILSTLKDICTFACSENRLTFGQQVDGVVVEVALQWCSDTFSDLLIGFVNSVKTIDGGTHIDGLKVSNCTTSSEKEHFHRLRRFISVCP